MITRKLLFLSVAAATSLYLVQGTSCIANDKAHIAGSVGAASVSAPGFSLKVNLERQVDDSQNLKSKPVQKAVPEPVCRGHRDLDKQLILGGADVLPM